MADERALTRVRWREAWRIIASRYPPIALFERVSDNPAVWDVLIELEQATNPRVRDEAGEIALVPPERRVTGPNASWVMAPFTHINRHGSRFSDGSYGVYYAARSLQTAIKETGYHFARFASDSNDPPRREDMRDVRKVLDNTGLYQAWFEELPKPAHHSVPVIGVRFMDMIAEGKMRLEDVEDIGKIIAGATRMPVPIAPTMPPMQGMPNTSSASS